MMSKHDSNKENTIADYLLEFMIGFVKATPVSFVRYLIVVGFVLLSLGGYLITDPVYRWVVFLLATFGLWKIFDRLDIFFEDFIDRISKRKK